MADEDAHFRIMDAALQHPEGRARGGESCVVCGNPIPAGAHWKQRDRHVCGPRCNALLRRRYGRNSHLLSMTPDRVDAAVDVAGPQPNPRTSGPRVFGTVDDSGPGQLPIEWEGYGPLLGDVVERYGVKTTYLAMDTPPGHFTDRVLGAIAVDAPHEMYVTGADEHGFATALTIGPHSFGAPTDSFFNHTFDVQGVTCEWRRELITDLFPDGVNHFRWECYAAVPVAAPPYPQPMHSPRYRAEMDRRRRISDNTSRHERRAREAAVIEKFDPLEVYERDGWFCQICGSEVSQGILHPDPLSASLDHVVPLSRGGDHTRANSVLAHLRCNIAKSNR